MNHSEDCERCDGSGFVAWYDEGSDWVDEDNCACVYLLASNDLLDDLCDECRKVNVGGHVKEDD